MTTNDSRPIPRVLYLAWCLVGLLLALPRTAAAQENAAPRPTERPYLWRIEGEVPSYLFGTIHLPDPRVTSVSRPVEAAIAASGALYTELPMEMDLQLKLAGKLYLPDRQTLKQVLPSEVYERLARYLKTKGLSIQMFQKLQVWALMAQLPVLPVMRKHPGHKPLDMTLYEDAKSAGKEVGGLETIEEQLHVFESFSTEEQVELLVSTLDQLEEADREGEDYVEKLIGLYLDGDVEALMEFMNERSDMDEALEQKLMKLLLWDRNERMADRIAAKLRDHPDKGFFFAVGAAHYPGEDGLVELLRRRGLEVTRLPESEAELEARIERLETELRGARARLEALRKAKTGRRPVGAGR